MREKLCRHLVQDPDGKIRVMVPTVLPDGRIIVHRPIEDGDRILQKTFGTAPSFKKLGLSHPADVRKGYWKSS